MQLRSGGRMNFVVEIDVNCGFRESDFQANSDPQSLWMALVESSQLRREGWIARIQVVS